MYPRASPNRVEITTKTGERLSESVEYHRGHHRNPCTDEEIERKFHSLSGELLTPAQRQDLLDMLWNLEQVDDIGEVMKSSTIGC